MNLVHNSDFLQSEKIIGISVGKSAPDQLHNKLLINFNNIQGELHLEFHHTLTFSLSDKKKIMKEQKIITVRIGNTIYPVENGWVMFGLGKK